MPTPAEIHAGLWKQLLEDYQTEYDDHLDAWRALEAKAQLVSVIAGVFLAAAFAFIRDLAGHSLHVYQLLSLVSAPIFLVFAILCALYVFKMAALEALPLGSFSHQRVLDVVRKDNELDEYVTRFLVERATQWQRAIEDATAVNSRKAQGVLLAQVFLVLAVVNTTVFTIWEMLK